jgi:hypothetical protein
MTLPTTVSCVICGRNSSNDTLAACPFSLSLGEVGDHITVARVMWKGKHTPLSLFTLNLVFSLLATQGMLWSGGVTNSSIRYVQDSL